MIAGSEGENKSSRKRKVDLITATPNPGFKKQRQSSTRKDSSQWNADQQWEDYCMAVALLSQERSKDGYKQVGACIVNSDRQIIAIGYNGLPNDDDFPWEESGRHNPVPDSQKRYYMCHAELNAIVNRTDHNLRGCTMYTTLSPCFQCAKLIIRSGIKEVVYAEEYRETAETEKLMEYSKFHSYRRYEPSAKSKKEIVIDLKHGTAGISLVATGELASRPSPDCTAAVTPKQKHGAVNRVVDLKWEDYHMAVAFLSSLHFHSESQLPDTLRQVAGACIVNEEGKIIGTGSSSLPNLRGEDPWSMDGELEITDSYICHAVMNAILSSTSSSLKGCTLYSTVFPCTECAKLIIQSGIGRVVFAKPKPLDGQEVSMKVLDQGRVCYKQYNAWASNRKKTKIVIDLAKAVMKDAMAVHMEYSP